MEYSKKIKRNNDAKNIASPRRAKKRILLKARPRAADTNCINTTMILIVIKTVPYPRGANFARFADW
eukprot:jgi/Bigna1/64625/fgenesh1_kg.80_\